MLSFFPLPSHHSQLSRKVCLCNAWKQDHRQNVTQLFICVRVYSVGPRIVLDVVVTVVVGTFAVVGPGGEGQKTNVFFQLCCVILFQASYSTHLHAHLPISKYLFNVSTLSQNHSFCSLAKLCLPISSNAYGPNLTYPTMTKPSQETWGNWGNAVAPLFKLARKRLHSEKWAWNFITVMSQLPALVLPSKEFCVSPATKTFPDASTCATASTAWVQS